MCELLPEKRFKRSEAIDLLHMTKGSFQALTGRLEKMGIWRPKTADTEQGGVFRLTVSNRGGRPSTWDHLSVEELLFIGIANKPEVDPDFEPVLLCELVSPFIADDEGSPSTFVHLLVRMFKSGEEPFIFLQKVFRGRAEGKAHVAVTESSARRSVTSAPVSSPGIVPYDAVECCCTTNAVLAREYMERSFFEFSMAVVPLRRRLWLPWAMLDPKGMGLPEFPDRQPPVLDQMDLTEDEAEVIRLVRGTNYFHGGELRLEVKTNTIHSAEFQEWQSFSTRIIQQLEQDSEIIRIERQRGKDGNWTGIIATRKKQFVD